MDPLNEFDTLKELQTADEKSLLDLVDNLRAVGIEEITTSLPQLVVCGDQSSGKSSVLQAISGVPFPRRDTLCTRHATEVVLRRAEEDSISVSIRPGPDNQDNELVTSFERTLENPDELAAVFDEAEKAMGLDDDADQFSKDTLRLEISGPDKPVLTLVDLPGYIQSVRGRQTRKDKKMIHQLVDKYIQNEETIVLAVVSAKYDIANQFVLNHVRDNNAGSRALGIITKPDTLHRGSRSETEFLDLAANKKERFGHDWHVLKNLDSEDPANATRDRDEEEAAFFEERPEWSSSGNRGIKTLRKRLSEILLGRIKKALPVLIKDIEEKLGVREAALKKVGKDGRATERELRQFLINIGVKYREIARDAINGNYYNSFFAEQDQAAKLWPAISKENQKLAKELSKIEMPGDLESENWMPALIDCMRDAEAVMSDYQGPQLPGLWNPMLVGALFNKYTKSWDDIAKDYIDSVYTLIQEFTWAAISSVADLKTAESIFGHWMEGELEKLKEHALQRLADLREVHRCPPMTLNVDFHAEFTHKKAVLVKTRLRDFTTQLAAGKEITAEAIATGINKIDMGEAYNHQVAASELVLATWCYYKITGRTFIDNVPSLTVMTPMLNKLPDLFNSKDIMDMDKDVLTLIAGEDQETIDERAKLKHEIHILSEGKNLCRRYTRNTTNFVKQNSPTPGRKSGGRLKVTQELSPPMTPESRLSAGSPMPRHRSPVSVQ